MEARNAAQRAREEAERAVGPAGGVTDEVARAGQDRITEQHEARLETQQRAAPRRGQSTQEWQEEELAARSVRRDQTAEGRGSRVAGRDQAAPSASRNPFADALGRVASVRDEVRGLLRGAGFLGLLSAARRVEFRQVGETLRIIGTRADRWRLGFVEMTNWIRGENIGRVITGNFRQAARSPRSWGVAFGLGLNLASDTAQFANGDYDRHEYAAALTIAGAVTSAYMLGIALEAAAELRQGAVGARWIASFLRACGISHPRWRSRRTSSEPNLKYPGIIQVLGRRFGRSCLAQLVDVVAARLGSRSTAPQRVSLHPPAVDCGRGEASAHG